MDFLVNNYFKRMILVFTWIQWCGKWTQARFLVEQHGFTLLEMGQELRNISMEDTPLGKKVKEIIDAWNLVTPDIVEEIMKEVIWRQTNDNLILDGFVRNQGNKDSIERITTDYKVLFFNLSKEKAIERLLGRMYNPNTGETFPSGTKIDPKTWDKLIKRKDDNEKSILTRINNFVKTTLPIVEIQKKEWKVLEVNANQSIEAVFQDIEKLVIKKNNC